MSNVVGIDLKSGAGVTVYASAEYLPFRDSCFDLVFAGEVIEHLQYPSKALKDWVRVITSSGTLVVTTPNGTLVGLEGNSPQHQTVLAPSDLRKLLENSGVRIIHAKGIFTGLFSGKRVFRWLRFDLVKVSLLRMPVPLMLAYDVAFVAQKRS